MSSVTTNILFIALFLVLLPTGAHAFGAGDIPDFAYLNGDYQTMIDLNGTVDGRHQIRLFVMAISKIS